MLINICKFIEYLSVPEGTPLPFRGTVSQYGRYRIVDTYNRSSKYMANRKKGQLITSCKRLQLIRMCLLARIPPPVIASPTIKTMIRRLYKANFAPLPVLQSLDEALLANIYRYIFASNYVLIDSIYMNII